MNDTYRPGQYKVVCDRCGFDFYSSEVVKDWDGLTVCFEDYDGRHPQDYVRGRRDVQRVPDPNPPGADVFIEAGDVTRDDL